MIEIRPALETDAKTLAELGRSTFIEAFAKDNREEDMELYVAATFGARKQLLEILDPNRRIEIAWVGSLAVGFVHLVKNTADPSVKGPRPIELLRLYVDSTWHGKAVGAFLMERAIHIACEEGYETLWLGVWERNFRAQAFYTKFGFIRVGEHIFRLGTDDQTDFIMARAVKVQ